MRCKSPKIMEILNLSPENFRKISKNSFLDDAIKNAFSIHEKGADILGIQVKTEQFCSKPISETEEMSCVIPVLEAIKNDYPLPISVETKNSSVARKSLELGVKMIGDVSGFENQGIRELAANCHADVCIMHKQDTPIKVLRSYSDNDSIISSLLMWFEKKISLLQHDGVKNSQIIIAPGFGFKKYYENKIDIYKFISKLKSLGYRLLLEGYFEPEKLVEKKREESLPATSILNTIALLNGADIVRVRDVAEHNDLTQKLHRIESLELEMAMRE